MAAARNPGQWVKLPTMPSGHSGSPRVPDNTGAGGTPSSLMARRAHMRTFAYSRRRFGRAFATAAAFCGYRAVSAAS
jgi:hypothetical protein